MSTMVAPPLITIAVFSFFTNHRIVGGSDGASCIIILQVKAGRNFLLTALDVVCYIATEHRIGYFGLTRGICTTSVNREGCETD